MKILIFFFILKFESLKNLSLGKKIVIVTVIAILAQAFGMILLLSLLVLANGNDIIKLFWVLDIFWY